MTTETFERETRLIHEHRRDVSVVVKPMETGYNWEVWLNDVRIASNQNPYGAKEIADGLEEFFFDQDYCVAEEDHDNH